MGKAVAAVNCCMQCLCRHTEEMIEKLESAGLGFYVKATETQQKLGELHAMFVGSLP